MPTWVDSAVGEYQKRLQEFCNFTITEIPLQKRSKHSQITPILDKEAKAILNTIPKGAYCIALDSTGTSFTSKKLADKISRLQIVESLWCFIIGGPEGLSATVRQRCQESWSLSELTLAHPLARIILSETLYRSFSILSNHPYHK